MWRRVVLFIQRQLDAKFQKRYFFWGELVFFTCLLGAIFCMSINYVPFHPDETDWIATSNVFEAFIAGDFASPVWNESYWTLAQPPLTRYIIGIGRSAGGYRNINLKKQYRWDLDEITNKANGTVPDEHLLWWSRLPMALMATVSALGLFTLLSNIAGRRGGYILLLLFAGNPYYFTTLVRAMSESPLLLGVLLIVFASYRALKIWSRMALEGVATKKSLLSSLVWFSIVGVCCGLAGAAKLNGLLIIGSSVVLAILAPLIQGGHLPKRLRLILMFSACALTVVAMATTFILLNPFLYDNPMGRTGKMIWHRLDEMRTQQIVLPESQINGIQQRITVVARRIFQNYAPLRFKGAWVINLILFMIGLTYLAYNTWAWLRWSSQSDATVALFIVGINSAVPGLLTPLDFDRYFLLTLIFVTICMTIGISILSKNISKMLGVTPFKHFCHESCIARFVAKLCQLRKF